jgi:hypothetical protein
MNWATAAFWTKAMSKPQSSRTTKNGVIRPTLSQPSRRPDSTPYSSTVSFLVAVKLPIVVR